MYLGTDPVQIDAYGCRLLGLDPSEAPYIALAEKWGTGSSQVEPEDIVLLNQPGPSASYPAPSRKVAALTQEVDARSACSACYASLVRALHLSGAKPGKTAIGQDWKGVPFEGLGIGRCCDGAARQVKGCPPSVADIIAALSE